MCRNKNSLWGSTKVSPCSTAVQPTRAAAWYHRNAHGTRLFICVSPDDRSCVNVQLSLLLLVR